MEQRLSLVTLGVRDVAASRAFYERHAFRADGARHVFGPDLNHQLEIRMVR